MAGDYYFEGDPSTTSTRRHLERVLRQEPKRRRWPWLLAALAGGALAFWRRRRGGTERSAA